jgi:cell division protein ZapA
VSRDLEPKGDASETHPEGDPLPTGHAGVEVEICGQRYIVRGEAEEGYVRELAAFVDERMREIAGRIPGAGLAKVAVLTAFNMSHELLQLRKEKRDKEGSVIRKTREMIELIEKQL